MKKNRHTYELSKLDKAEIARVIRTSLTLVLQAVHETDRICPMCFADMVIANVKDLKDGMMKARKKRGGGACPTKKST
jgi:hypothetical protein